jgi:GAF domain-containing protein
LTISPYFFIINHINSIGALIMFTYELIETDNKKEFYNRLNKYLDALLGDDRDWLSGLCNASALLYNLMPDINWAGFYLYRDEELVLGPFQGKPACVRIPIGKGVCGSAAASLKVQVVKNTEEFPGHIVCDPASRSEIVLPIVKGDNLIGVLDIDSPVLNRFDMEDAKGLGEFINILFSRIEYNGVLV